MTKEKAVFLDRDGVVNELIYFQEQELLTLPLPRINSFYVPCSLAIKRFQNKGYKVLSFRTNPVSRKGT